MYEVVVRGLHAYGYHGVSENEQELGHRLTLDLTVWAEGEAPTTDHVRDTVDYIRLAQTALDASSERKYRTLEALSRAIADRVLTDFPLVRKVEVRTMKPLPPAPVVVDSVGVTMTVERHAP